MDLIRRYMDRCGFSGGGRIERKPMILVKGEIVILNGDEYERREFAIVDQGEANTAIRLLRHLNDLTGGDGPTLTVGEKDDDAAAWERFIKCTDGDDG